MRSRQANRPRTVPHVLEHAELGELGDHSRKIKEVLEAREAHVALDLPVNYAQIQLGAARKKLLVYLSAASEPRTFSDTCPHERFDVASQPDLGAGQCRKTQLRDRNTVSRSTFDGGSKYVGKSGVRQEPARVMGKNYVHPSFERFG
jgi:hypothetical protein